MSSETLSVLNRLNNILFYFLHKKLTQINLKSRACPTMFLMKRGGVMTHIKHLKLAVIILFFSITGYAGDLSLEEEMKIIGAQFGVIAKAVNKAGAVSDQEIMAAKTIQRAVAGSALIYPDTADDDKLKVQYSQLMAQLMEKSLMMEDAIQAQISQNPQDLTAISGLLVEMNDLRREGHNEFKF